MPCPEGYIEVERKELIELSDEEMQKIFDGDDVVMIIYGARKSPIEITIRQKGE